MTEAKSYPAKQEASCSLHFHCVDKWMKIVVSIQLMLTTFATIVCIPMSIEFESEGIKARNGSTFSLIFLDVIKTNNDMIRKTGNDTNYWICGAALSISFIGLLAGYVLLGITLKSESIPGKLFNSAGIIFILLLCLDASFGFDRLYEFVIPATLFLITIIPYSFGIYILLILIVTCYKKSPYLDYYYLGQKRH